MERCETRDLPCVVVALVHECQVILLMRFICRSSTQRNINYSESLNLSYAHIHVAPTHRRRHNVGVRILRHEESCQAIQSCLALSSVNNHCVTCKHTE